MKTLQELAQEALAVQDACNLSGVAQGFGRAMLDLCKHVTDTVERNNHPVARVWADKIASLTGTQSFDENNAASQAYDWCHTVAETGHVPNCNDGRVACPGCAASPRSKKVS